ncbi:hypothetical protein B4125_3262 [Bacillus paralicheniformis]|nr:hypothetical protein B4125_3262 [Bacillus paralicheniformis]
MIFSFLFVIIDALNKKRGPPYFASAHRPFSIPNGHWSGCEESQHIGSGHP